jgi:CRP-like cAMP-binding protein
METRVFHDILLRSAVGQGLEQAEIEFIADLGSQHHAEKGSEIFKEGENADCMVILLSGEVVVLKKDRHGNDHELATLGTGSILGEIGILESHSRTATVRCKEPVTYFALHAKAFNKLIASGSPAAMKLTLAIARTLARRQQAINDRLVEVLDQPAMERERIDLSRFRSRMFSSLHYPG